MNTYEMLEEAAHRAYTRGIQTGNGGNLSARADFGMIVKSSGGSFADCLADGTGFVETDLDGSVLSPSGKPTREVVQPGAGGIESRRAGSLPGKNSKSLIRGTP